MSAKLPYLTTPGSLTNALNKIKSAATPQTFNADFVHATLGIKGGAGSAIPPLLKKLGFVAGDGSPTNIYRRFRSAATSGTAAAEALKIGYKAVYKIDESAHELSDTELKGLMVQVTGLASDDRVLRLALSTFKKLKTFATFDAGEKESPEPEGESEDRDGLREAEPDREFNIAYTINLNLPPTTNIEVFNAIFKSMKENLLRGK